MIAIIKTNTATPFATPVLGVNENVKLRDRINALFAKIMAFFTRADAAPQAELSLPKIEDPFAKLTQIQRQLSSPEPDLDACLAQLAEIEASLPKLEQRDKTDRCVADTVEMLLIKPQDIRQAHFTQAMDALQAQAHVLLEGQERKSRFISAKEAMESRAADLARRQNFLSSKQALEKLGPTLMAGKEQIAKAEKTKAKRYTRSKAHLEKRAGQLLRGQEKHALASTYKKIAYDAIENAQSNYQKAKNSVHKLKLKASIAKAEGMIVERQIVYLQSQTIGQHFSTGLAKARLQAERLRLKILAKGRGEKAKKAAEDLAALENAPKARTNLEIRNASFNTVISQTKTILKAILNESKMRVRASSMPKETQEAIISEQKKLFASSLRSLASFARHVSENRLYVASGQKGFVTVSQKELEKYLKECEASRREVVDKVDSTGSYLALEGKSANDVKKGRGAYIGPESMILRSIAKHIKNLKKYDKVLAKRLAETPVLDIEVK